MSDAPDVELLQQFARNQSEAAFAELVQRHIGLVYSMAFRKTENPQLAQDITQAVFIILARKAGSLSPKTVLAGWLYHTTRLTAANLQRAEIRRAHREQEAFMQSTTNEPAPDALWSEMSPLLEDAMAGLGASDRDAIVLRYFQNRSLMEVGMALGASEAAAKMRVNRALEKLRKFFTKRGVDSTPAIIAGAISSHSVQAVPAALAKSVTAVALAKGATATISTLTLAKGALKVMAWTKAKTGVTVAIGILLVAASTSPYVWYYHLGPHAWQHRFDAIYSLRNGEVLRHIPQPFIPERLTYYQTVVNPAQVQAVPTGPSCFILSQNGQGNLKYHFCVFGPRRFPLGLALQTEFGFKPYEFEGPNQLLNLTVNGDWTISEGLSPDALLVALEPILWKVTNHHVIFERQILERNVIVATGNHFTVPPGNSIQIYAKNLHDNSYDRYGDLNSLFNEVGERLKLRFIDETTIDPQSSEIKNLTWTLHNDSDLRGAKKHPTESTDNILKNLASQTGLTFTHEQRPEPVWIVTEK